MEKSSYKENIRRSIGSKQKATSLNGVNKENEKVLNVDSFPFIRNISVKSSEILFEEKCPEKYKIRFRKHLFISEQDVLAVRFDKSDSLIANGTSDGQVRIFNVKTGKPSYSFSSSLMGALQVKQENSVNSISALRWNPSYDDLLLCADTKGHLFQFKVSENSLVSKIHEVNNEIFALDYNMNGELLASAGKDAKIRIYDESTKKLMMTLGSKQWVSPGHNNRIFAVKFINDNPNVLISGGWDNCVYLWDIRAQKSIDSIFGACVMGDSIDYKNSEILIGNQKGKDHLQLYDFKTRKLIQSMEWESGYKIEGINIYTAHFCKTNEDLIVAGASGGSNQMKVFSKSMNYNQVFSASYLPKGCYTSDFGNEGNSFVFGGGEGFIYLCTVAHA